MAEPSVGPVYLEFFFNKDKVFRFSHVCMYVCIYVCMYMCSVIPYPTRFLFQSSLRFCQQCRRSPQPGTDPVWMFLYFHEQKKWCALSPFPLNLSLSLSAILKKTCNTVLCLLKVLCLFIFTSVGLQRCC
jgi:hypothetical protein